VKLHIIAVGNRMPDWVDAGFEEYAKRMPREARITLVEIKPEKREGGKSVEQILSAEATRIESALPQGADIIVLDERGVAVSTKQFADWLKGFMGEGRDAAFVIGSADGLHPNIKQHAKRLLSLSALTMPHGMARMLLAEQLYRAISLLQNHPYHRE
jgi:23S rRNA (pseudouridine1915-N3)-methyltransferase